MSKKICFKLSLDSLEYNYPIAGSNQPFIEKTRQFYLITRNLEVGKMMILCLESFRVKNTIINLDIPRPTFNGLT